MEHANVDDMRELDDTWIKEFYKLETEYNDFYKEVPRTAVTFFLYLNRKNEIIATKKDNIVLDKQGVYKKIDVINLINKNKIITDYDTSEAVPKTFPISKMGLHSILKYNFTVDPDDVLDMLGNKLDGTQFLTEINAIQDIKFKETVHFFGEMNTLYIFYKERTKHSTTKKIHLKTKQTKRRTRYKRT